MLSTPAETSRSSRDEARRGEHGRLVRVPGGPGLHLRGCCDRDVHHDLPTVRHERRGSHCLRRLRRCGVRVPDPGSDVQHHLHAVRQHVQDAAPPCDHAHQALVRDRGPGLHHGLRSAGRR